MTLAIRQMQTTSFPYDVTLYPQGWTSRWHGCWWYGDIRMLTECEGNKNGTDIWKITYQFLKRQNTKVDHMTQQLSSLICLSKQNKTKQITCLPKNLCMSIDLFIIGNIWKKLVSVNWHMGKYFCVQWNIAQQWKELRFRYKYMHNRSPTGHKKL